jgi:transposase-like protein
MKVKSTKINRKKVDWYLDQPFETQLELMKNHLEICRIVINTMLDTAAEEKSGPRYSHDKPHNGRYSRWGFNRGSVKLGSQKIPVEVQRIYDNEACRHVPLEQYDQLKQLPDQDRMMVQSVLHGLSMRDYEKVVDKLSDSFGISGGSVSRRFQEKSKAALEEFEKRKLNDHRFVALLVDGKEFSGQQMVIALGVTEQGNKIPLGVIQTTTENARSIKGLFRDLINRGLQYDDGILIVIDGSKGLYKAAKDVFEHKALIQRCQWHKRENVVSYLPEEMKREIRHRLQSAYRQPKYEDARAELLQIKKELEQVNRAAARSLEEGMEETLTIHKLGLIMVFSRSFGTTNCIESVNSQLRKYTGRVKHWMNSEQRYRWVICGLMEIEPRLKKVANYKKIPLLQKKLKEEVIKAENENAKSAA